MPNKSLPNQAQTIFSIISRGHIQGGDEMRDWEDITTPEKTLAYGVILRAVLDGCYRVDCHTAQIWRDQARYWLRSDSTHECSLDWWLDYAGLEKSYWKKKLKKIAKIAEEVEPTEYMLARRRGQNYDKKKC
jgi:hypothetical protein